MQNDVVGIIVETLLADIEQVWIEKKLYTLP